MHTNSQSISEPILALAIRKQADTIRPVLDGLPVASPSSEFVIGLRGIPDATLAKVQGVRRFDGHYRVAVLSVDGRPFNDPPLIDIEPAPAPELQVEDGSVTGKNGSRWYPAPGGMQREVVDIDDAGEEVTRAVNTDRYSLQMTCSCGTVRYAMKNSIHQVDQCRVCARKRRHAYQVSWQREKRKAKAHERHS